MKASIRIILTALFSLQVGLAAAQPAAKNVYPDRQLRMIVGSAPGGGGDMVARLIANHISSDFGQSVIVENKPGVSGVLAAQEVMKAPADGYTLFLGLTQLTQLPAVTKKDMGIVVERDFIPVSLITKSRNILMVNTALKVDSVEGLVGKIKEDPKSMSYGSWGNGTTGHFWGEMLATGAGAAMTHVPYRGASAMMVDLLGGTIPFAFPDSGSALPHMTSSRVKPLAITGLTRLEAFPELPTMLELGYKGFEGGGWFGFFVRHDTPDAIVEKLAKSVKAAVQSPEVKSRLQAAGLEPIGNTTAEFKEFIAQDVKYWKDLATKQNISVD